MIHSKDSSDFLEVLQIQDQNYGVAIGGKEWLKNTNVNNLSSFNPTDNTVIAKVYEGNRADYHTVIEHAHQAFGTWRMLPAPKRGEVVRAIGEKLRQYKKELGALVSLEMGKILQEGEGEVQEMIDIADFAVGLSRQLYGKTMHSEREQHRMYEQYHPLGIVGVISAFNFPVAVWSWNALIAAVCGNVVVWKPSLKTPLCAVAVQHICDEVLKDFGLTGIFNLVIGSDQDVGEALTEDHRVPLISATGSTRMGQHVATKVAARLGKTILELGGNNGIILDKDADFSLAIPAIVFGAVGTAGQRCTTTRRLFVHHSQYEEVLMQLKNAYAQIAIGNPLEGALLGPLIDQAAVNDYENAIALAKSQGGEVVYGGSALHHQAGNFVEPTLIKAKSSFDIVKTETFAPILYVMSYEHLDEAIQMHNDVPQGLSSAIFTNNLISAETFLSHQGSDCGIANVNIGTSGAEIGGAFGGEKETGGGREAGSDAWKAYMRRQTNTINWGAKLPLAQGIKFEI